MRINAKGQVTIPAEIRKKAGLLPHAEVEVEYDGVAVLIFRIEDRAKGRRGTRLVALLRGSGDGTLSTDEIMALTRGED